MVESDGNRLKQLLFVLVYNALKYTNKGYIHVKVKTRTIISQQILRIKVEDTGCGMTAELTKKLFTLFSNVKFKKQVNQHGIGLGLSKCHTIVSMLGGHI